MSTRETRGWVERGGRLIMGPSETSRTVGDWIEYWARLTPEAPALLEHGRDPLTYRDFDEICVLFRSTLNARGFGRRDRVALVHPGGADMGAALAAVWGCAAAVPLNPEYTAGEFAIYFKDLRVDCLLIAAEMDSPARDAAARLDIPVLELVRTNERIAGAITLQGGASAKTARPGRTGPDDPALVVFTSGTTSHAKIVPRTQLAQAYNGLDFATAAPLSADDRLLTLLPLFHSGGVSSGFSTPLVSGGSVIVMPNFDADAFFGYLATHRPTWYNAAPVFHQEILSVSPRYQDAIAASNLRFIRSAGAHLHSEIAKALETTFGVPVTGGYGCGEAGQITNNGTTFATRVRDSVGRPETSEVAIVGPDGRHLDPGQAGEIVVRGPQVFDGYEGDEEANAVSFRDGWFHTGDEGRFDENGFLFLTGRIKELINRGGEKVSPSEVDEVLLRHHDVAEAATFPIPHPTLGEEVAAAVVLKEWAGLDAHKLARFARQHLTGFKVPRRILFVDEIPKQGTAGKVQRGQLAKAFGLDQATDARRGDAPTLAREPTPLENQLAEMWARALGVEKVGLDDDFFLLGGDSLQAVELFLEIEAEMGRRLPRAVLFEASTVAEMARRIGDETPVGCVVPIQPEGDLPPFFCVHGATGEVLSFGALATHLGPRQPFYGVQSPGLDGNAMPFSRIEDMASYYVGEVRKVQDRGPYYLGGYSSGGRIAVEMARQLRAAGEAIAFIGLVDAYSFIGPNTLGLGTRMAINLSRMGEMTPQQRLSFALSKATSRGAVIAAAVRRGFYRLGVTQGEVGTGPPPKYLTDIEQINMAMNARFRPEPYDGTAVLFKAARNRWANPRMYDGWRQIVTGGIEVRPIPSGHDDIVREPHVRTLAAELGECLTAAQQAQATGRESVAAPAIGIRA